MIMEGVAGKVKVAAVSYLNTKPLLYGLERLPLKDEIILSVDHPARIGEQLISGEVDLGLIPVALIPRLNDHHVITDYCIGAEGPVASVCLFSDVPLEEITAVYLDFESRSSVALARYLMRKYWKISPKLLEAGPGYEKQITGTVAGVVIGDRALRQRKVSRYIYDLAEAWIDHTGLPMVFAAWISNKPLEEGFIARFNEATGLGTRGPALEDVLNRTTCDFYDLREYYTRHISFELTGRKKEGLAQFLEVL
jgi:chorismate dehydratase